MCLLSVNSVTIQTCTRLLHKVVVTTLIRPPFDGATVWYTRVNKRLTRHGATTIRQPTQTAALRPKVSVIVDSGLCHRDVNDLR